MEERRLEWMHRAGFKLALGIPPQTATRAVLTESRALPLKQASERQLMRHVVRIYGTTVGKQLLNRVADRACSQYSETLHILRCELAYVEYMPPLALSSVPLWKIRGATCVEYIKDVRRTRTAPVVLRASAKDEIEASFNTYLHNYTDGSVFRGQV